MDPTPTSVLLKDGMMYPVIGNYVTNCGIGIVAVANNLSTCPVAVPTLIYEALLLGGLCGADGAI